jgi:hypothetical protein
MLRPANNPMGNHRSNKFMANPLLNSMADMEHLKDMHSSQALHHPRR